MLLLNRTGLQSAALKIQPDGPTVMFVALQPQTQLCTLMGSSAVKQCSPQFAVDVTSVALSGCCSFGALWSLSSRTYRTLVGQVLSPNLTIFAIDPF